MIFDIEFMKRFCAPKTEACDYLQTPFRIGEHVYASNGFICVRLTDDGSIQVGDLPADKRSIARIFGGEYNCDIAIPQLPEPIKCKHCKGSGISHESDCDECDGDGEFRYGSHYYDCKECDSSGKLKTADPSATKEPCWHCDGRGAERHQPVEIGGSNFNRFLLALIVDLPGVKMTRIDGLSTALFVFDGGEGAIMPTRL